ncbi:MAG: ATP-dependent DNA helicase, partial [candidate division FCPU426 bacterium]
MGPPDMTPTGNTRKDFSPQGLLSSALPGFEPREAQVQMAEAVDQALEDGDILVVEAGTGVGKSLAYLLPALRRAFAPEGEAKSLLLSTATLTLQDQLLSKDIPVALKALGISAEQAADRVVRAMGRANYFCRLRFEMLDTPLGPELFEAPARSNALKIGAWAAREPEPVRDRLPFEVDAGVWEKVNVDAFGCLGAACPHARDCFFLKERERLRRAKVAVVNHAMLLSDVAARRDRSALLPDMDFLVVDEAHHLERMASEHLGIRLGMLELEQALNPVMDPRSGKGLAARLGFPGELALQTAESRSAAHHLFDQAAGHLKVSGATVGPHGFDDAVSGHLLAVAATLKKSAEALNDEALASEVKAAAIRLEKAADGLRAWLGQTLPAQVYWMEPRGRKGDLVLRSAPLRAGEALAAELYPRFASIIFTSATLATHKGLGFSKTRLGLPEATSELVLGSPFDYRTQVQMHLDTRVSDPRKGEEAYLESLERAVKDALIRSQGRAFVLFTSFRHLHALAL